MSVALVRARPAPRPRGAVACRSVDPEVFFPPGGVDRLIEQARAVCRACPLRDACLEYALAWDVDGIWGGTTRDERQAVRAAQGIAPLPVLTFWTAEGDREQPGPKPARVLAPSPEPVDEGDPMPPASTVHESVDALIDAARQLEDRKVIAALEKAETAIGKLRDLYEETAARIADEKAAEEARAAAVAEVERLRAALAAAEQKAAEAGAKVRTTRSRPAQTGGPQTKDVRAWARQHGIDVPDRGRIPGDVMEKYEAAHAAVAA